MACMIDCGNRDAAIGGLEVSRVSFVATKSGKKTLLGIISGLPVYCPNADRIVRIQLNADVIPPEQGEIEFNFVEIDRGKSGASARLLIPRPG